jgi:hypothetical protein
MVRIPRRGVGKFPKFVGVLDSAVACIEDPPVIERILNHLASKDIPGL